MKQNIVDYGKKRKRIFSTGQLKTRKAILKRFAETRGSNIDYKTNTESRRMRATENDFKNELVNTK